MYAILSAAVFLTSFSALAYEVLLTRFFAISQWHHLAFMVISLSLFGFSASGTVLGLLGHRRQGWEQRMTTPAAIIRWVGLYAIVHLGSFVGLVHLPLDYFRLPLEPIQWLYLLLAYLLPAAPFFVAGAIVSLAYARFPDQSGRTYALNMVAAAMGAACPILLLSVFKEEQLILVCGLLPWGILSWAAIQGGPADSRATLRGPGRRLGGSVCLAAALIILMDGDGRLWQPAAGIRSTPYKDLYQARLLPETGITASTTSIRGRLDTVAGPYIRFAPGLSLKYGGSVQGSRAIFHDGDGRFVLYPKDGLAFGDHSLWASGILAAPSPVRPLLIIADGGTAMAAALAAGTRDPVVLVRHPEIARMLGRHYGLSVTVSDPATYLAASNEQFDLILIENWSSAMAGTTALIQEHLYTLEAFERYLGHLNPEGVLVISRRLRLPPSDTLRLWATAYEALSRLGTRFPERHLILLRNFDTFTLLVGRHPLGAMPQLKQFVRANNFDWVFADTIGSADVNRFNVFDSPHHYLALKGLNEAYRARRQNRFFDTYPLDVTPQTDARPFPNHVVKWRRLARLYEMTGKRGYTMWLSGEVIVLGVLAIAVLVSLTLILPPWLVGSRHSARPTIGQSLYFFGVGAGFILAEMAAIYQFSLVIGDPTVSFATVLTLILVISGLGGRLGAKMSTRQVSICICLLAAQLAFSAWAAGPVCQWLLQFSAPIRYLAVGLLLMPTAALMGVPFAAGMQSMLENPLQRVIAWAANGSASVLMAVVAAALAMELGFAAVFVCAAGGYLLAALCWVSRFHWRRPPGGLEINSK